MIIVKQLRVGGFDDNFSYLAVDSESHDAFIVDPCGNVDFIRKTVESFHDIKPKYILLTHGHGDHTSGVSQVKEFFGSPVYGHPASSFPIDIALKDRENLEFGATFIETLYAPGHTKDSVIYHLRDDSAVFTGDTLFIDWCGYCNAETMFATMRNVVYPLADSNVVYSGHDYGRKPYAPLGEEKISNPYLNAKTIEEFKEALKNL